MTRILVIGSQRVNVTKGQLFNFTARKVSRHGVFSGPYFPAFGLNKERYSVSLRIQSECGKIRTRENSVFGHFSRSAQLSFSGFFCKFLLFFIFVILKWFVFYQRKLSVALKLNKGKINEFDEERKHDSDNIRNKCSLRSVAEIMNLKLLSFILLQ